MEDLTAKLEKMESLDNSLLLEVTESPEEINTISELPEMETPEITDTEEAEPGRPTNLNFSFLPEKTIVKVVDTVIPTIIVVISGFLGMKLNKKALQMTAEERKTIEPILSDCMKTIAIDFNNPWTALLVALSAIYGAKTVEVAFDTYEAKKESREATIELKTKVVNTVIQNAPIKPGLTRKPGETRGRKPKTD